MSTPERDDSHVAEGLGYLTSRFRGKPGIVAALTAALTSIQEIEDDLWDVIAAGTLSTPPTGDALQKIAELVGAPPSGFTDAQLLLFVQVYIRARKSGGRAEDIIPMLATVLTSFSYDEWYPQGFQVTAIGIPPTYVLPIALALRIARPPATEAVFDYSLAPAAQTMTFGDSVSHALGKGFADSYSAAYRFGLAASIQV